MDNNLDRQLLEIVNNLDFSSVGDDTDMSSSTRKAPQQQQYSPRYMPRINSPPPYRENFSTSYNKPMEARRETPIDYYEDFTARDTRQNSIDDQSEYIDFDNLKIDDVELDDIDIDKIINSEEEVDSNIDKDKNIPDIFQTMKKYLDNLTYEMYPHKRNCRNKLLIFIIRLVQLVCIIFIVLGFILPNKILKFHIILCLLTLITYDLFENKNAISLLVKNVGGYKKYHPLIPHTAKNIKSFILVVMIISIFGLIVPKYSIFSMINKLFVFFRKLN